MSRRPCSGALWITAGAACLLVTSQTGAQVNHLRTERVATLAGPHQPTVMRTTGGDQLRFYGTDLGYAYEHDGTLYILFGDTWDREDFACLESPPESDDMIGVISLDEVPTGSDAVRLLNMEGARSPMRVPGRSTLFPFLPRSPRTRLALTPRNNRPGILQCLWREDDSHD